LLTKYPKYKLIVTGHSLGAARASLCSLDIYKRMGIKPILYTFGEPRVGDYTFSQQFNNNFTSYRLTNTRDTVPHLAPCCSYSKLSYSCTRSSSCPYHHGTEVLYHDASNHVICNYEDPEDNSCSNAYSSNIIDYTSHRFYMGVQVSTYCSDTVVSSLVDERNITNTKINFDNDVCTRTRTFTAPDGNVWKIINLPCRKK